MRPEHWLYTVPLRLRSVLRRGRVEHELDEEIRDHIERQVAHNIAAGMESVDARIAALRSFGGVAYQKDQVRDARRVDVVEHVLQDLRYAIRTLGRRPGFVSAVVVTLALGIGANTAVFSLIDAVLLHPLSVAQPERLVEIDQAVTDKALREGVSYPQYRAMAARARSFTGLAAFRTTETAVRSEGITEQLSVAAVSGSYFGVLGIAPQVGRLLIPADDDVPGAHPVAVVNDALWERLFHRRAGAVGSTVHLGATRFTIVGVAPPGFRGTDLSRAPQVWVPLTMLTDIGAGGMFGPRNRTVIFSSPNSHLFTLLGRLRPGVSGDESAADLDAILDQEHQLHPPRSTAAMGYAGTSVKAPMRVVPVVQAATVGDRENLTRFVSVMLVVVLLTLLIACVNVANLQLVRSTERAHELSLRASLGASQGRIVQQLLLESMLLSLAGAAVGLGIGAGTLHLLSAFTLPGNIALSSLSLRLDTRVLVFTVLLSVATAFGFGLVPAWHASRPSLVALLRSGTPARRQRSRELLLGAQVAMSLVLLIGAALFVRSLGAGLGTDIGFDPRSLAAVTVNPTLGGHTPAEVAQYYGEVRDAARRLPGVTGAALTTSVPLSTIGGSLPFTPGPTPPTGAAPVDAGWVSVSPEYFDLLHIPLLAGRPFLATDDRTGPTIAIVNETAAHELFPDGRPLGREILHAGEYRFTIVGVVKDTKYESVRDDHRPVVFTPIVQGAEAVSVIVRSDNPAAALVSLRRLLGTLPPRPPLRDARLVAQQIDAALMPQRFGSTLLGVFGVVALVICAIGIYSVVSYAVSQRTAELGIRIALGAQRGDIARLVLARTGLVVGAGIALGLGAAALGSRGLARFLYGVTPLDLVAFVGASAVVGCAAVIAAIAPARRAARIDPLAAIRSE